MCYTNNEKWKNTMERIEVLNQDKIRRLGEKKIY